MILVLCCLAAFFLKELKLAKNGQNSKDQLVKWLCMYVYQIHHVTLSSANTACMKIKNNIMVLEPVQLSFSTSETALGSLTVLFI